MYAEDFGSQCLADLLMLSSKNYQTHRLRFGDHFERATTKDNEDYEFARMALNMRFQVEKLEKILAVSSPAIRDTMEKILDEARASRQGLVDRMSDEAKSVYKY